MTDSVKTRRYNSPARREQAWKNLAKRRRRANGRRAANDHITEGHGHLVVLTQVVVAVVDQGEGELGPAGSRRGLDLELLLARHPAVDAVQLPQVDAIDPQALRDAATIVVTERMGEPTAFRLRIEVDAIDEVRRVRVGAELKAAGAHASAPPDPSTRFPLTIESPNDIATQVINYVLYELPLEDLQAQDDAALNRLLQAQLPKAVEEALAGAQASVTRSMERLIREGHVSGVLDVTTVADLCYHLPHRSQPGGRPVG